MNDNRRIIHTNLYGAKTFEFLSMFHKIISNYVGCYGKTQRTLEECQIEIAPDGEVVIAVKHTDSWYYRRTCFYNRPTDAAAIDWFCKIMKERIIAILANQDMSTVDKRWSRDNDEKINVKYNSYNVKYNYDFTFKISDAYCLYDLLKGRKTVNQKYDGAQIALFKGQPKDPVATELEIARRENLANIEAKYRELGDNLNEEYWKKERELRDQLQNWRSDKELELKRAKEKEIAECNQMAAFMC